MDPPKPNKDSAGYKNLREALKRSTDKGQETPKAAPPSGEASQPPQPPRPKPKPQPPAESQPESAQAQPAATEEVPRYIPPSHEAGGKKYWIKSKPLRGLISLTLLGVTGWCLWYIWVFKLNREGEMRWPWETFWEGAEGTQTNVVAKPAPAKMTTSTVAPAQPAVGEEEKKKLAEEQRLAKEKAEAERKAAEEKKRQEEALAAQASIEEAELRSVTALEGILKGYYAHLQYEQAAQYMSQVGDSLTTDKAKQELRRLQAGHQPLADFKKTLIANISSIEYKGNPIVNRQSGRSMGIPTKADEQKIYFTSPYGEIGTVWVSLPRDQIASLAGWYLKEKEKASASKELAQDYYNLMIFCLSQKLTSLAAEYGTDAITIDRSLRPQVKAYLGNLIR